MSDKKVHLVIIDSWPCPGSHYLHTKKFLKSFDAHGFEYSEIKSMSDIEYINKGDFVYLSNHGFSNPSLPFELFEAISSRGANQILWFWHDNLDIKSWEIQNTIDEYVPLTFASNLKPNEIGTFERTDKYLAHFVGYGYKPEINKRLRIRFRGVKIQNTPPFISEERRREIFLSSKVALGWHSDDNIKNNVVVERVFEGLAFGNAVISDTPVAREITDGIVEFADSYDETKDFLLRIKKDDRFRQTKMELGLAWAKAHGTYWHVAKRFIDHFES